MKKILTMAAVVVLGTMASYSQGLVSIALTTQNASTNGATSSGRVIGALGTYDFELLVAPTTIASSASNILNNAANLALWTDTTVSGANTGSGLSAGKITASGSATATGWLAPGVTYDNPMSFIIVGWSTAQYGNWAAVVNAIDGAGLAGGGYFGTTTVDTGTAGGGSVPLPAINEWGNVPGGGITLNLVVVPEPTTIALASLGGMALLAFRRRKA